MHKSIQILFISVCLGSGYSFSAIPTDLGVYLLPMNCSELLPDPGIFLGFMESAAKGHATSDRSLSKRIFRILSIRNRLEGAISKHSDRNPVDILIFKTLCFYREQKEPTRAIPFDDPPFVSYLRQALPELENRVDDVIFQAEFERNLRDRYERKLEANQQLVAQLQAEAERDAENSYSRIANTARKKARQ